MSTCSTMRWAVASWPAGLKSGFTPSKKAAPRISRWRSLSVMTRLPTETAMRSMISAGAAIARTANASAARTHGFLTRHSRNQTGEPFFDAEARRHREKRGEEKGKNKVKTRSEEHTSELQSLRHLVCRL